MKKLAVLIFVALLLMQSGGLYMVLKTHELTARISMQQRMRTNRCRIETIRMDMQHFSASLNEEGELLYQGGLYDIQSLSREGRLVTIYAVRDTYEETVLNLISLLNERDRDHSPADPDLILDFTFLCYTSNLNTSEAPVLQSIRTFRAHTQTRILQALQEIPSPPPKSV
jgi:hypothetical protein